MYHYTTGEYMEDLIRRKDMKDLFCIACVMTWGPCAMPERQCKAMMAIDGLPAVKFETIIKTEAKNDG